MTCKENCLHYELCEFHREKEGEPSCDKANCKACRFFKNKADFQEVKHGEWIATGWMKETSPRQFQFRCSNCDKEKRQPRGKVWLTKSQKKPRYCVCCGARMDGGKK